MRVYGRAGDGERGQVAVEAALVLPLMVFLLLGLIQLTAMQQARLLTEYAAYSAARAGIVWNGNNERMHDAALVAVLPTLGRTDGVDRFGATWTQAVAHDAAVQALPWGGTPVPETINGVGLRGAVRVDTVSPANWAELGALWNVRGGPQWQELDFDAPDTISELEGMPAHLPSFFDRALEDESQTLYRKATVLRVRVRYLYELKIPFANFVIFTSWFATNAGELLYGAIDRPTLEAGANMVNEKSDLSALEGRGRGISHQRGFSTLYPDEMRTLWRLSTGAQPLATSAGGAKRFFIPLSATYSMRMQSNFHRKWLVHDAPSWSP